jgi:hypothetical protein
MKGCVRVVHCIIDNIYNSKVRGAQITDNPYSQNTKDPEMVPLAIAVGKRTCASRVIGRESIENKTGGMTSRNLEKKQVRRGGLVIRTINVLIHGHVMMNAMQQEVDHQKLGMIRQIIVDMKQASVETIFEQSPHKITKDEA